MDQLIKFSGAISEQCIKAAQDLGEAHLVDQVGDVEGCLLNVLGDKEQLVKLKWVFNEFTRANNPSDEHQKQVSAQMKAILEKTGEEQELKRSSEFRMLKRKVFEAGHPEETLPAELADNGAAAVDEDTDMIVAETRQSTTCPLTQTTFQEPVKNQACGHTYSRVAILQQLGRGGAIACPITGCRSRVTQMDLVPDTAMAERLERLSNRIF